MIKDPVQSVTETLSAVSAMANMKRLLEAYRSLAPHTIGGPSSTSLETQTLPGRLPTDPRFIKKFVPYPFLMGPVFPPPGLTSQALPTGQSVLMSKACSDNSRASPAPPIFSPRDKESSRLRPWCVTLSSSQCSIA